MHKCYLTFFNDRNREAGKKVGVRDEIIISMIGAIFLKSDLLQFLLPFSLSLLFDQSLPFFFAAYSFLKQALLLADRDVTFLHGQHLIIDFRQLVSGGSKKL